MDAEEKRFMESLCFRLIRGGSKAKLRITEGGKVLPLLFRDTLRLAVPSRRNKLGLAF